METLKVNVWKMILYVNITTLVLAGIVLMTLLGFKWDDSSLTKVIIVVVCYVLISVGFSIIVPKTFSMKYDKKSFYLTRFGREEVFDFANVLYIDTYYTEKHKALTFYLKTGKLKFISFDKDKKIIEVFESHCKNLISREEFHVKFPTIKL